MIPAHIIRSLRSTGCTSWLFAFAVKDFRGILSDERQSDHELRAGDHASILPYNKGATIAFLFFMQEGNVVIVADDGYRDCSLPPRLPQQFDLSDCASVSTTLMTEDSKNGFVLFFSLKPSVTFTPHFDEGAHSQSIKAQDHVDAGLVLVDDALPFKSDECASNVGSCQELEGSFISVDDALGYSGLGFKLLNPAFVDNCVHLKDVDHKQSIKRFNDFICDKMQSLGAKDKGGRIIMVTSAYMHVTIGIPRNKPENIVDDLTLLLDYQIPEPEKSCSISSGVQPRSTTSGIMHRKISVKVSVGDFARLDKGECLSDAAIDFYSCWLRETFPEKCRSVYFASSFFFKKLWIQQKESKQFTEFSYMHKWNAIDIFSFEMIMFPVNLNYHWSLIVLENPAALLQQKGAARCRLLYLDSLSTWDEQISRLFGQWISWMLVMKTSPQGPPKTPKTPENYAVLLLEGVKQVPLLCIPCPFIFRHLT
jgi:hypothetical protein